MELLLRSSKQTTAMDSQEWCIYICCRYAAYCTFMKFNAGVEGAIKRLLSKNRQEFMNSVCFFFYQCEYFSALSRHSITGSFRMKTDFLKWFHTYRIFCKAQMNLIYTHQCCTVCSRSLFLVNFCTMNLGKWTS
jgi:hypothetical protein